MEKIELNVVMSKDEFDELEWILNFYLYENGLEHDMEYIMTVETIKGKLGMTQELQLNK